MAMPTFPAASSSSSCEGAVLEKRMACASEYDLSRRPPPPLSVWWSRRNADEASKGTDSDMLMMCRDRERWK